MRTAHIMQMVGDPDPYVCTHYWGLTSGVTDPNSIADSALLTIVQFFDRIKPFLSTSLSGTEVEWTAKVNGETLSGSMTPVTSLVGTNAAAVAPPNNAYLVTRKAATGGRKGKGRVFIPSVMEGFVDNVGQVNPTERTSLRVAFEGFVSDVINLSDEISSYVINSTGGAPAFVPVMREVTSIGVSNLIATQRRRLRK